MRSVRGNYRQKQFLEADRFSTTTSCTLHVLVFEMSFTHGFSGKIYWLHLNTFVLTIPSLVSVQAHLLQRVTKASHVAVISLTIFHNIDTDLLQHNPSGSQHSSLTTSCYLQLHKSNDPPRPRSPHHRALDMHRPALAVNRPLGGLLPAYHPRRTLHEGPRLDNLGLAVGGLGVGGGGG